MYHLFQRFENQYKKLQHLSTLQTPIHTAFQISGNENAEIL